VCSMIASIAACSSTPLAGAAIARIFVINGQGGTRSVTAFTDFAASGGEDFKRSQFCRKYMTWQDERFNHSLR
jgi:hypothetical protein